MILGLDRYQHHPASPGQHTVINSGMTYCRKCRRRHRVIEIREIGSTHWTPYVMTCPKNKYASCPQKSKSGKAWLPV